MRKRFNLQKLFRKKSSRTTVGIIAFIVLFVFFFVYLPFTRIKTRAADLSASAKELKKAFSQNDLDLVKKNLDTVSQKYDAFRKESSSVYWLSFIPYASDFKNGVEAGSYLLKAGQESIDAIAPYADLIGFKKGQSSFVEKSADERLQTAVLTLDKIVGHIDPISQNIEEAEKRVKTINPDRYPETLGKTQLRSQVSQFKDTVEGVSTLFVDAKPLLKRLPEILGKDKKQTYLIIFQNDKERRATGGFLTSYAIFTIEKGKIKKEESDDIYQLDNSLSSHPRAPREILAYHKNVYQLYIRDSNLSPDFVESIKLFNELYDKSSRKVNYDGVIAVDSKVLVDMLTTFGDTEAGGIVFSAKNDKRCNCPQVLYQLFDVVDRPVNYVKENRKGILGQLMQGLLLKVLGFSPSKYWGPFLEDTLTNLKQKHILLYFTNADIQQSVEKLNFAGRIQPFNGDYLHLNNVNFAGAKSNLFVRETLESKTNTKSSGGIEREVMVTYKNPSPPSDCNLERGGLCLNATLRNWVRVYVPKGAKLITFTGSETPVKTYDDLGKTVFEGFLRVNPLGLAKVDVKYKLPESVSTNNYQLMVQKQPGVDTMQLQVTVDGSRIYDKLFLTDVILGAQH